MCRVLRLHTHMHKDTTPFQLRQNSLFEYWKSNLRPVRCCFSTAILNRIWSVVHSYTHLSRGFGHRTTEFAFNCISMVCLLSKRCESNSVACILKSNYSKRNAKCKMRIANYGQTLNQMHKICIDAVNVSAICHWHTDTPDECPHAGITTEHRINNNWFYNSKLIFLRISNGNRNREISWSQLFACIEARKIFFQCLNSLTDKNKIVFNDISLLNDRNTLLTPFWARCSQFYVNKSKIVENNFSIFSFSKHRQVIASNSH